MRKTFVSALSAGLALLVALVLSGCSGPNSSGQSATSTPQSTGSTGAGTKTAEDSQQGVSADLLAVDMSWGHLDEDDDYADWQSEDYTAIALSGQTATVEGEGAAIGGKVVTISDEGIYVLSGEMTDGVLLVDAGDDDVVRIVLNNASLSCSDGAPIFVRNADKVILSLPEGTQNTLADAAEYAYEWFDSDEGEPSAALFSKDDLVINGSGALTIAASANDGIACKDDLKITGGILNITATDDGLVGKDMVAISDVQLTVACGGDGIKSTDDSETEHGIVVISGGAFSITAGADGIQAENVVYIGGGDFALVTGGGSAVASNKEGSGWGGQGGMKGPKGNLPGQNSSAASDGTELQTTETLAETSGNGAVQTDSAAVDPFAVEEAEGVSASAKGIKAKVAVIIAGGTLTIDSSDDALHSGGDLLVSGGALSIQSGDDGAHADGTLSVTGGSIVVSKSYEGLEASNIDLCGDIDIVSSDDGINIAGGNDGSALGGRPGMGGFQATDGMLTITGGTLKVNASGDGLDSNGGIAISGGTIYVSGPTNDGNGAFDYAGACEVTGGTFVIAGSAGMAQVPSSCTQVCWCGTVSGQAGDAVEVRDDSGNVVVSFTPEKAFAHVVITSPGLVPGQSYTLWVGGSQAESATLAAGVTVFGSFGGMGGGPGGK